MPYRRARLSPPPLPTIAEHPSPPRPPTPPAVTRYAAGDRLLVVTPDGRRHTAVVVLRRISGLPAPVPWLRLATGQLTPLAPETVTVLRRLP